MSNDATTTLVGSLGSDLDLKFLDSGMCIGNFSVACREQKKENGEYVDADASWFDCKVFGKMAENLAETVGKGSRVVVTGKLKQEKWETDSGDKRSRVVVMVDNVGPDLRWATASVSKNEKGGGSGGGSGGGQRQQASSQAPANPYA